MVILFRTSKQISQYEVTIDTYNKGCESSRNSLTYLCSVQQKRETFRGDVINFKRQNILLNNTAIHDAITEIVLISGEILYDLDLEISQYGKILKVKNLKDIQQKWDKIKFKLENTYLGNIVTTIIESIDRTVSDQSHFIELLHKDPFFYNFTQQVYGDYYGEKIFISEISNFGGIRNISIEKKTVVEETDNKERIIQGTGNLSKTVKEQLLEEMEIENISLDINTTHHLCSDKYLVRVDLQQELKIDGEVFASQIMHIVKR